MNDAVFLIPGEIKGSERARQGLDTSVGRFFGRTPDLSDQRALLIGKKSGGLGYKKTAAISRGGSIKKRP
ncbi:MAG: hypothetical protein NC357_08810 [Bacteroides sp.]|nr:hypothetical protein [Bacteroides sp.]